MNILISGCAGDIGFGVGRVLRDWGHFQNLIGIDIHDNHPGGILFDRVAIAPRADDPTYIDWLCRFIEKHNIGLFIPTSEAEISVISQNYSIVSTVAKVLINDAKLVKICLDKHATLDYLQSKGLEVPEHGLVGTNVPTKFPVIAKPRRGQGNKGIKKIESNNDLDIMSDEQVWQEMLLPKNQEYTCAVYVTSTLDIRLLQLKRTLLGGMTDKAEVVDNPAITDYIQKITSIFAAPGCYNVQLRLTEKGPLLFEINPRLSSTLVFRDKLEFFDLRWWVCDALDLTPPAFIKPKIGTKIFRGNIEYIVPNNARMD